MNIETSSINQTTNSQSVKTSSTKTGDSSVSFAEELKSEANLKSQQESSKLESVSEKVEEQTCNETEKAEKQATSKVEQSEVGVNLKNSKEGDLGKAIEGLNLVVQEFNQSDDKFSTHIKQDNIFDDNNNMINNEFNIQENKDLMPQMNPNMNFSGNGTLPLLSNNGTRQCSKDSYF